MLLNINNKLENIKDTEVLYNLYYNLAELPTKINKESKSTSLQDSKSTSLQNLKDEISKIDNYIPLYDIFSRNIYLIKPEEIYNKVTNLYYRPLNKELYDYLKSIKTKDKSYKEKLDKNIKFMDNFNLKILEDTYIKTFYYQSNKIGKNFTLCIKPSFLPFVNINPYYNRDELINMGLNLKVIKEDNTFYDKDKLDSLCTKVSDLEIDSDTLLNHYLFIQENNIKYFIKYYSFMGSSHINFYLRNVCNKDKHIENNIKNLYDIIAKAPSFNKSYYVYRLVDKDNYLKNIRIGGYFEDRSFISTSRNPFYNPTTNTFGQILIKIKLPKNIEGVGLCIENYSLFPEENEIILNPCKLKLIAKDSSSLVYYHTDKKAQRSITTKYEFEYVAPLKLNLNILTKNYDYEIEVPYIDIFNVYVNGGNIYEKIQNFEEMLPLVNTSRRFYTEINNKNILINVNKMNDKRIYEKFFFLQKNKYNEEDIIEELYLTYQDEKTGEILLMIEIKDVISVNYLQKFTGCNKEFNDEDLLLLISGIAKMFDIFSVIIHPNFKAFSTVINVSPEEYKYVINNETDYHSIKKLSNDIILFNNDLMNYIMTKKDRFNNINIKMNYKRYMLDKLKNIEISEVFTKENYEIYSVIKNDKNLKNLNDLLIFIFKNYFYLLDKVIYHINLYFDDNLIINKLYYKFDASNYLFEKEILNYSINNDDTLVENYIKKLDIYNIKKKER
jgi:hypothetical protein